MLQGPPTGGGGPSPLQVRYMAVEKRVMDDMCVSIGANSNDDDACSSDGEEQSLIAEAVGMQTRSTPAVYNFLVDFLIGCCVPIISYSQKGT